MSEADEPTHTRLGWQGDDFVPPQCWLCAHRNRDPKAYGSACVAFLGGIPDDFTLNRIDHREPVDYDGGTQFLLDPDADVGAYLRLDVFFRNVKLAEPGEPG